MFKSLLKLFWLGLILIPLQVLSQDNPSFYQYTFQTASFNPAAVGKTPGFTLQLANRRQFANIPNSPQTLLLGGHFRVPNSKIGLGLLMTNDRTSDFERRLTLGLQLGYHIINEEDQHLSLGVSLGYWGLNGDYSNALTGVPETGLGERLIFQQGVLDANLGLHYMYQGESSQFFFDLATQNLPAAFLSYADRIDPYGLQIPAQIVNVTRLRFQLGEQFALEPGFMLRLHPTARREGDTQSYSLIKPGNTLVQLKAYVQMGDVGYLWLGPGSTLKGNPFLSFGLDLQNLGLQLYGFGGPHPRLGFSDEVGIVYCQGCKEEPDPACLPGKLNQVDSEFQIAKGNFPNDAKSSGALYRGRDLILPFIYPDYEWGEYRLSELGKQAAFVNHVIATSKDLISCDEINPPAKFRVLARLQDPASSLDDLTTGTYTGPKQTITYQLLASPDDSSGESKTITIEAGGLNQEQIQVLKLYEIKQQILARYGVGTEVQICIVVNQTQQIDPKMIQLEIILDIKRSSS